MLSIHPLTESFRDFDRFFEDVVERPRQKMQPLFRYDWIQKKDSYLLNVDLPGIKPEDVSIEFEDGRLTIEAERKPLNLEEGEKFITSRSSHGKFVQSFSVGDEVDAAKADALFQDGVLQLTLPRKEESKPKKINLRVGGADPKAIPTRNVEH